MARVDNIIKQQVWEKTFISFLLISSFISCKKKNETPPNNNEMKATVVLSPTNTIDINATGSKVVLHTRGTVIGPSAWVTNEAGASVSIKASPVTGPGTYRFSCYYIQNSTALNAPSYEGSGDGLTFTTINDKYMEGYFTAIVCRCSSGGCVLGVDSVIISGTFKGDHIN